MAGNRTRVPVHGTIGKSVPIPQVPASAGAIIGVNLKLPNGSIPTLQQLAAALATGAATQDSPGNINPGTGSQAVIWQNIQYIPAQITYPGRAVQHDDDDQGEDYGRMALPGPIGMRGPQGSPGMFADDPDDVAVIPGPPGAAGVAGVAGASGATLLPDDPEDPTIIPGPPGAIGPAGPSGTGAPGAPGINIAQWPDEPEDPGLIPGAAGPPGAVGTIGPQGPLGAAVWYTTDEAEDQMPLAGPRGVQGLAGLPIFLWPDDAEDPGLVPGASGPAGATGAQGAAIWFTQDDGEDVTIIPGPPGATGATGATGPAGSGAGIGWVYIPEEDESDLTALRALPNNPQFQTVTVNAPATGVALALTGASGLSVATVAVVGGGTGVVITGTAATQLNAWSVQQAGQAPWLWYSPASSNDLRLSSTGDRVVFAATGNVTINTPTSGVALTVNGATSAASWAVRAVGFAGTTAFTGLTQLGVGIGGSTGTTDYSGIDFTDTTVPKARIAAIFTGGGSSLLLGTSNNYTTGITNAALTIGPAGTLTIAAPSSGVPLTISGGGTGVVLSANQTSNSGQIVAPLQMSMGTSGGDYPYVGYNISTTITTGSYTYTTTDFASRIKFQTGGIQVQTAASGTVGGAITFATTFSVTSAGMFCNSWGSQSGLQTIVAGSGLAINGPTTINQSSGGTGLSIAAVVASGNPAILSLADGQAAPHTWQLRTNNLSTGDFNIYDLSRAVNTLNISSTGAVLIAGTFAINGGAPAARPTGYGTPVGTPTASITSASTLAQVAGTLAAFLVYMKGLGFVNT